VNIRQVAAVVIANEDEASLVNGLAEAWQAVFNEVDILKSVEAGNNRLLKRIAQAEYHVASLYAESARQTLCRNVELSRRRNELIALAGELADRSSFVLPLSGEEAFSTLNPERDSDGDEVFTVCGDCLNAFASVEALEAHMDAGCPVAAIKESAEEALTLDDLADGPDYISDNEEVDNAEYLEASFGGNETDLPAY
jgi:hypothetical protein